MPFFPVSSSILSATDLGDFIQKTYGINADIECSILRSGINDTYSVKSANELYVFRIYHLGWRSKLDISEEIRLIDALKSNGILVSHPIKDKAGNYIQSFDAPEGQRYGVLFSFARGEKLRSASKDIHFKIGVLMSRIHQKTEGFRLERVTYDSRMLVIEPMIHIRKFLPEKTEEMAFMEETQGKLTDQFSGINAKELRHGAVHLDIWYDNLHINERGEATIFDFDFCGNGWLVMDIAYYVLQIYNIERVESERKIKLDSFFEGYESVTKISTEERRIIPMLGVSLYFFYLGIQCQRYDDWSNRFLDKNYVKGYINGNIKRYYDLIK